MSRVIISDELVMLLHCIATQKRGHSIEQIRFLNRMEKRLFEEDSE